jgi:hypothetical protein
VFLREKGRKEGIFLGKRGERALKNRLPKRKTVFHPNSIGYLTYIIPHLLPIVNILE